MDTGPFWSSTFRPQVCLETTHFQARTLIMAPSNIFGLTWTARRLLLLCQIISIAVGEIRLECVRDLADYYRGDYEWNASPFYTWKYAATADRLPSIFQGKLQGTGIFYADGADGTGSNTFIRDATEPVPSPTPGYLYIKDYMHRTNTSDVYTIARPVKGIDGFAVTLPTNDDFNWEEQLIQVDIEAANSMGFWVSC